MNDKWIPVWDERSYYTEVLSEEELWRERT